MPARRALLALALLPLAACGPSEDERRRAFIAFLRTRTAAPPGAPLPEVTDFDRRVLGPYAAQWNVITGFRTAMGIRDYELVQAMRDMTIFGTPQVFALPPLVYLGGRQDLAQRRDALHRARDAAGRVRAALNQEFDRAEAGRASLPQSADLAAAYGAAYGRLVRDWHRVHAPYYATLEDGLAAAARLADALADNTALVRTSIASIETSDAALRARLEEQVREVVARGEAFQQADRGRRDFVNAR